MSTINPSFQAGGSAAGWKIKEGAILGWQDDSGLFKPAGGTFTRNSGNATYVDANGLIQTEYRDNWPRITYSGGRACLMNEEARTNLVTYSEQFDNAAWTKTNATISANATTAPDGATTADELIEDSATSTHFIQQSVSVSATNYTMSCFVKYNSSRNWVYLNQGGANARAYFDIQNGVVGTTTNAVSASITNYGNGWYRCDLVATQPSATSRVFLVGLADSDNSDSYLGDGTSGVFAWGAQVEAGSYASSYILTEGAAATRAAESIEWTGLGNFLGDSEGGVFLDFDYQQALINNTIFRIQNSGATKYLEILALSTFNLRVRYYDGSGVSGDISTSTPPTEGRHKAFFSWNGTSLTFVLDGVEIGTSTMSETPSGFSELDFFTNGNMPLIYENKAYTTEVSSAEMETETT